MTNLIEPISLFASRSDIGLVSLQRDDLSIHLWIAEGLDGGIARRGDDDIIPFQTGKRRVRHVADDRAIILNGYVADTGASPLAGYRTAMDELLSIFAESDEALVIIATLEDGSVRWAECYHPNILAPSQDKGPGLKAVSVALSAEPYWYGTLNPGTLDDGGNFDDGGALDDTAVISLVPTSDPYDYPISVPGTADTERVTIWLTASPPSTSGVLGVSVRESGVGFLFPPPDSGALMTVASDPRARSVTKTFAGATTNARAVMTINAANRPGEYIRLPHGASTLRIFGKPSAVTIRYTPTYE